jgi:hypothetical protein
MFNVINTYRGPYRGGVGTVGLRRNHISNVPQGEYGKKNGLDVLYIKKKKKKRKKKGHDIVLDISFKWCIVSSLFIAGKVS